MYNQRQTKFPEFTWQCKGEKLPLGGRTLIMGILNVTPDSFSDGGKFSAIDTAVDRALQMQEQGADIIDIGGESTRPGSAPLPLQQELDRVIPVIEQLATSLRIPISIDTYKAVVAEQAVKAGAAIINDISGANFDTKMPQVMAQTGAGCVLMHIKGEPRHMQINPFYTDVIAEINQYFQASIDKLQQAGVQASQIVLDPGIGFGKRLSDNYVITQKLNDFLPLGFPLLYGPSRKSFIGNVLNLPPEERVEGTIAACTAAILNGAHILRVHDVQQLKRAATIADILANRIEITA